MKKTIAILPLIVFFSFVVCPPLQAGIISKGVREIVEAIAKRGTKEAAQELAEFGGKKAIREALEKAAREGGDEVVEKVIRYGKRFGVAAVRAMDNAPVPYARGLEGLPKKFVERALWAAQRNPEGVTQLVKKYGSDGLLIAAKHRGIGPDLVARLGDDAIRLGKALPEEKGILLAHHAKEIAHLPSSMRKKVVDKILSVPSKAMDYLEKHPKVLLTSAGVTAFLGSKDQILGKDEEPIIGPDGEKRVRQYGFIERFLDQFRGSVEIILLIVALILAGWGTIKIWGAYKLQKLKISNKKREYGH